MYNTYCIQSTEGDISMFQFLKGEKDTALILQIINFIFGIIRQILGLDVPGTSDEEEE